MSELPIAWLHKSQMMLIWIILAAAVGYLIGGLSGIAVGVIVVILVPAVVAFYLTRSEREPTSEPAKPTPAWAVWVAVALLAALLAICVWYYWPS